MRRDTLHLTLAFLGEVAAERLEALAELAGAIRIPPFEQTFDKAQCLPRKKIFWASASRVATELRELAGALSDRLKAADFRTEARPFAAHVTLLRHARCDRQMPPEELRLVWPVRDFVLVESELSPEGARYRILRRWPLDQT